MSFPIYFVKGKEKNKSVLSNCRSCYMAHHPGLRAFPPAPPRHLWQQEQAVASRLQNWGGKLACASRGFSFFVRRDISSLWGAGNRGGRSEGAQRVWVLALGCSHQGWEGCSAGTCLVPRKASGKWWPFGILTSLEEGNKLAVLTFSPLHFLFIHIHWENTRQLVERILILF